MLLTVVVTFTLSAALTPLLTRLAHRYGLLDIPNSRSSHERATPRAGGIGVVLAVLIGSAGLSFISPPDLSVAMQRVLLGAECIAILGLADDVRPLPALLRLAIQTLIAAIIVATVGSPTLPGPLGLVSAPLAVFWLVAVTNAYNFMDGIDGIAGGQAVVAAGGWVAIGLIAGSRDSVATGLLVGAAVAGFLIYNWHPAKVFLGDSGSGFLGFTFAGLPLTMPSAGWSEWLAGTFLLWPFLFDTGITLVRRAGRGENVLSAHRTHLYQRLIVTGLSHRQVAIIYAGLSLAGAVPALLFGARWLGAGALSIPILVVAATALWVYTGSREHARALTLPGGNSPGNTLTGNAFTAEPRKTTGLLRVSERSDSLQ